MSTSRDGPNPLRPYYVPPLVGLPSEANSRISTTSKTHSEYGSASPRTTSFGSSTRDILADIDYSEYLSDSSPSTTARQLAEQAIWKYASVFLAQPFEIAKTILQVHATNRDVSPWKDRQEGENSCRKGITYQDRGDLYNLSDDSDDDSQSYFTSSAPLPDTQPQTSRSRHKRGSADSNHLSQADPPRTPPALGPHTLQLRSSSSLIAVLSALWSKEGAWGIWKGTNCTYVYSILLSTITSFSRSFISALLALPDPGLSFSVAAPSATAGGLDILSSPAPLSSLVVAVSAAGLAGIILAPLDIARTKLMLTPSTHPPRSVVSTLQSLPSWTLPLSIAPVTFLYSTVATLVSGSVPLILRSKFRVDPLLKPTLYSLGTFTSQVMELFIKLPLETVLRRGQLHVAQANVHDFEMQKVVEVAPYKGLVGTMLHIVNEERDRSGRSQLHKDVAGAPALKAGRVGAGAQRRKGQNLEGLWRGWRIGMWGLVGVWTATSVGGPGNRGGEF